MTTRIYLVAACIGGMAQAARLIEAGTAAAARNHATRDMLSVRPATAKEVAKLIKDGTCLEIANEAPIEQQQLPGTTSQDDGTTGGAGLGSMPALPDPNVVDAEVDGGEFGKVHAAHNAAPAGSAADAVWPHTDTGSRSRNRNRNRKSVGAS